MGKDVVVLLVVSGLVLHELLGANPAGKGVFIKKMMNMAYYKRHIDEKLLQWKDSARRKPLLIRGARQVGKSTAVRELAKQFRFLQVNCSQGTCKTIPIFCGNQFGETT